MEILQEIVNHLSFDIRTFVYFSGHTLSIEIETNRRLKLPENIGDMVFTRNGNLLLFILQGR